MSVINTTAYSGPYTGNGATVAFPFDFSVNDATDVVAYVDGVETSTGFTVTINPGIGGFVVFDVAPANGVKVVPALNPSFTQTVSFEDAGAFLPSSHDAAFDKVTRQTIYLRDRALASVRAPHGETLSELPPAADRLGKFLAFDGDGDLVPATGTGTDTDLRTDLAAAAGASLSGFLPSGVSPATRSVQSKLRDFTSSADYVDHVAADVAGRFVFVPADIVSARANGGAIIATHWGPGRLTTADGNKRGKFFSNITSAPASLGDHSSINTAFNGDLSRSIFQVEHRITGAATLSQPTSGYVHTPEALPFYGVLYNESGFNFGTADNSGRTGAAFFRVNIKQYGQGDLAAYNATAFVTGGKPGSTHFLANPAAVLFSGDMSAGADGAYLNPREIVCHDQGYDVACLGDVVNLDRTDATGAKSAYWGAYRVQSIGSAPVNNLFAATGKFNTGIDLAMTDLDFGANKAAISLKADDRIYFGNVSSNDYYTTTFNQHYLTYGSGISAFNFVVNNDSIMQVGAAQIAFLKPPVLPTVTASGLPAAAPANKGMEYYVSDLTSTTRGAAAAGGGANFGKVYSTGSAWLIA